MGAEERNVGEGVAITLFAGGVRAVVGGVWKGRVACGEGVRLGVV